MKTIWSALKKRWRYAVSRSTRLFESKEGYTPDLAKLLKDKEK